MADESMPAPDSGESDTLDLDTEIPVRQDSLETDGSRVEVGDSATIKIDGTVTRIENNCVYVKPEKVNDTDLAQILAEHQQGGEDDMMAQMTAKADQTGTPMGGGEGY